jgi:hypothetical protein
MAEEKGCCCNGAIDKALKVTVILFLVYIMLGGLFMFVAMTLRNHENPGMVKRAPIGVEGQLPGDSGCGCGLKGDAEIIK